MLRSTRGRAVAVVAVELGDDGMVDSDISELGGEETGVLAVKGELGGD